MTRRSSGCPRPAGRVNAFCETSSTRMANEGQAATPRARRSRPAASIPVPASTSRSVDSRSRRGSASARGNTPLLPRTTPVAVSTRRSSRTRRPRLARPAKPLLPRTSRCSELSPAAAYRRTPRSMRSHNVLASAVSARSVSRGSDAAVKSVPSRWGCRNPQSPQSTSNATHCGKAVVRRVGGWGKNPRNGQFARTTA